MRKHLLTLALVVTMSLVGSTIAMLFGLESASGGTAAPSMVCSAATGVTGPAYSGPSGAGTSYNLTVGGAGVTCAFATTWMRKLATRKIGKLPTTIAGPAGWRCNGILVAPGWPLKAYQGICKKGARKFVWSPKVGGIGG
jgi:hypothetical protein